MYKKIITMTGWRRPDYTKQVIDNLKQCIGFEEYLLLPTIEPGYPEVLRTFKDLPNCEVVQNDKILGCSSNTLKALQRGFELSDFVIHIEDDTVPGIDSLKYFEFINKTYKDNKEIFTATAYNRIEKIDPKNYFALYKCPYFTGWMWATWKDRFDEMLKNWDYNAWDININRKIRGNRYEICPNLSRSQNIGQFLGTYTRPRNWSICQYSSTWINNIPDISNIISSNMISNMQDINDLPYHEISSNSNGSKASNLCIPECYDIFEQSIGVATVIGIGYIIYKSTHPKSMKYSI